MIASGSAFSTSRSAWAWLVAKTRSTPLELNLSQAAAYGQVACSQREPASCLSPVSWQRCLGARVSPGWSGWSGWCGAAAHGGRRLVGVPTVSPRRLALWQDTTTGPSWQPGVLTGGTPQAYCVSWHVVLE
jgi:hypothetical protein